MRKSGISESVQLHRAPKKASFIFKRGKVKRGRTELKKKVSLMLSVFSTFGNSDHGERRSKARVVSVVVKSNILVYKNPTHRARSENSL